VPLFTSNFEKNDSSGLAAEALWLKRWFWVFPAIGFPAGIIINALFWWAVTLDASYLPASWPAWISAKGLLLGAVLSLAPVPWRLGLLFESRYAGFIRRYSIAAILAVFAGLAVEGGYGLHPAQELFWQAVRMRAGGEYFTREVSLFRLSDASYRAGEKQKAGILVVGSSQMLHALDEEELASLTGLPVYRRATAGMFPVEMLAWRDMLAYDEAHTLLMMVSGFDIGGTDHFYANRIRPLATVGGMADVISVAPGGLLRENWRSVMDLSTAAVVDLWRSRDFARHIMMHPFGHLPSRAAAASDRGELDRQLAGYLNLGANEAMSELSLRSLRLFMERMSARYPRVVVLEGQVNPVYANDPGYVELSARLQGVLRELAEKSVIDYVPLDRQRIQLPPSVWLDNVHVNAMGRTLYSREFSRIINDLGANGSGHP
jgi:hypothetical protein